MPNILPSRTSLVPLHAGVLMLFSGGLPSFRNTLRFLMHCLLKGLYFKDLVLNKDLFGIWGPYLYPYFYYFGFTHSNCLIFAGIGSGLHCYQFFIFTYAYALIFIHRCFGSLFWPLGVLIGSLFHKKMGPY